MLVPHRQLSTPTLRAIVEEFVTRDGTDHSLIEKRIEVVLEQLNSKQVELHYDHGSATTNIVHTATSNDDQA